MGALTHLVWVQQALPETVPPGCCRRSDKAGCVHVPPTLRSPHRDMPGGVQAQRERRLLRFPDFVRRRKFIPRYSSDVVESLDEPLRFTNNHNEPKKVVVMAAFTVRVPEETATKLDQLAEKLDRSRSYMAAQAIEDFIAREEWQLAEIEAGLTEADRGEFATDDEVASVVSKYVKPARQS